MLTLSACAPASPPPAPAPSQASAPIPPASAPASVEAPAPPVPSSPVVDASPPALTLRVRKRSPVRCNAAQTNTPCIYKKGADCFFRGTNCTHLPCTEAPHAKTACDAAITALAKPLARVCIDVKGMTLDTVVRVYEGDSSSDTPYGPVSRPDVRLCADGADRPWRIEVDDRKGTKLEGTLDWSKGSCATLDLSAATLKMGCAEPFTGTPVEGRL